jgi:diguanylate cyclase (GGDEF)-like protein
MTMSESILVVDDDPDVARFIEVNLRSAGYDVNVASDGEQALAVAVDLRPDLILLDVMMPKLDGFEVAQRLRRDPRTSSCSIIMLTAKALSADKVLGLSSGADDYIIKPFDPVELLARVKGTLRRAREMRALSPLTGLPGNIRIQEEIRRLVAEEPQSFGLLYLDLDHFKAYNDHYGFVRGDRAIQAMARLTTEVVQEMGEPGDFVGHVGGDDFVVIVAPGLAEIIAEKLCERFDEETPNLYDRIDQERGTVELEDRQGNLQAFPLLSVSIGGVTAPPRRFAHFGEVVEIATEMKQVAKRTSGSSFAFDRRTT